MSQDIIIFKEEILKTLREFKENIMKNMNTKLSELGEKDIQFEKSFKIFI